MTTSVVVPWLRLPPKPYDRPMVRVLVVRGGWDGHQPVQTSGLVAGLLREAGCQVEVSGTLASYSEDAMSDVDLVVQCWTMGEIGPG